MSLEEIRKWFYMLKRRRALGDVVPTVSEIANRVGVSRQTIYALLRNERTSYDSIADLKAGLKTYFGFFNQERTHQSIARQTPDEV